MSDAEARILEALATYTDRSAAQLCQMTGMPVGSVYPALAALEEREEITSRWFYEDGAFPRRRVYRRKHG